MSILINIKNCTNEGGVGLASGYRNVHERASDVTDAFDAGAENDEVGHRVTQGKDYEEADHRH